jgi:hypothetical protein
LPSTEIDHQALTRRKVEPMVRGFFPAAEQETIREWPLRRVAQTLGVSAASVYLAKHRIAAALKREVARLERAQW